MTSRTPLVLLHPFPVDGSFWEPMRGHLTHDAVDRVDAPGFGQAPPEDDWSIAGFADRVAERVRGTSPSGRAVVMGLSMGGYVALELALRHPDVLSGLVLADTRAAADDTLAQDGRDAAIRAIREDGLDRYLDGFLPRTLAAAAPAEVRRALDGMARRQAPAAVIAALRALRARRDVTGLLAEIVCPTLVIVGDQDALTPPDMAQVLADGIPAASLTVIGGVGHMSALEAPRTVAGHVDALCETIVD